MASIISVDTLQDSAGSNEITTANVKTAFDDRVKAWVNFDGTGTIAARDSLNVSSLTDIGTGYYGITFSNNMANVGYSIVASGRELASWVPNGGEQYQAYYNFKTVNTSFSVVDANIISSNVHGDLA